MRIISASRRTDIPAFYTQWFLNRLEAGYCHWLNPFSGKISKVSLLPQEAEIIFFWTRNPAPILPYLAHLLKMGWKFAFNFTINDYPNPIETLNIPLSQSLDCFLQISDLLSADCIIWRYDPIIITNKTPPEYHIEKFSQLCKALAGKTKVCHTSFVSLYGKTKKRFLEIERNSDMCFSQINTNQAAALLDKMSNIAQEHKIKLKVCCMPELVALGFPQARCIDPDIIRILAPNAANSIKFRPTRPGCGCYASVDIGAYDTCGFGCSYCYATNNWQLAQYRLLQHDPSDTILFRPLWLRNIEIESITHDIKK